MKDKEKEQDIKEILDFRNINSKLQYLIKQLDVRLKVNFKSYQKILTMQRSLKNFIDYNPIDYKNLYYDLVIQKEERDITNYTRFEHILI